MLPVYAWNSIEEQLLMCAVPPVEKTLNEQLYDVIIDRDGTVDAARDLVRAGADVNYAPQEATHRYRKKPLLSIAAIHVLQRVDMVEFLISEGADVNARDEGGNTPLLSAAERGKPKIAAALMEAGSDLLASEKTERNVLHASVSNARYRLPMTTYFAELGAPVERKNKTGKTAMNYARSQGCYDDIAAIMRNLKPLPRLRVADGEVIAKESLFANDTEQRCKLDHPTTWHQMWDHLDEPLTKEDLLERTDRNGRPWMARAIECRQFDRVKASLEAQGESLAEASIWVDAKGQPTEALNALAKKQQANKLFTKEFSDQLPLDDVKRIYQAIDPEQRGQVQNFHQLVAARTRAERAESREMRRYG